MREHSPSAVWFWQVVCQIYLDVTLGILFNVCSANKRDVLGIDRKLYICKRCTAMVNAAGCTGGRDAGSSPSLFACYFFTEVTEVFSFLGVFPQVFFLVTNIFSGQVPFTSVGKLLIDKGVQVGLCECRQHVLPLGALGCSEQ